MSKKSKKAGTGTAETGKFVVRRLGKRAGGGESWRIIGSKGEIARTVKTSAKSANTISRIAARHSKALKRLADK